MSPRESNPDRLSRRLRGEDSIFQAIEAARSFGRDQWLADDELARLCVVIEELVANLFDHGGLTAKDEVQLDLASDPEGVRVTIVHPGASFDPWSAQRNAERPERGGGAGIDIVRAWAQFVSYDALADGNRLEFLLPLQWEN